MRLRTLAALALAAAGTTAYQLQWRRDLRAIRSDPEWSELNRDLAHETRTVTSGDGTQLHVETFGPADAPPIVLVHGWVEAIRLWHHQIRDLAGEFRVIAYDQRGHGSSRMPATAAYTDAALAGDLNAVLDACLRPGERCVVAGHSMGGMSIVAWAGRNADRVSQRLAGAVLVNTGMSEMPSHSKLFGDHAGPHLHEWLAPAVLASPLRAPTMLEPISLRAVRRIALASDASLAKVAFCHQMFLTAPAPVRRGFGRMMIPLDLMPAVASLAVPTIVIASEHDLLLPPWHAEQLAAALPIVDEHVVLPGIGHIATIEAPDEVTSRLLRLARRVHAQPQAAVAG